MDRISVAKELLRVAKRLVSGIEFDTSPWKLSNGGEPKGRGSWAFSLDKRGDEAVKLSPSMTYQEAKKWARQQPEWRGADVLYVQP